METKTIVYPTDFSACAENALHYAVTMAKALDGTIHMVHFLDVSKTLATDESPIRVMREIELMEMDAKKELNKRTTKIMDRKVACACEVLKGDRYSWLPNYVREEKPMMIVMGTKGTNNLENKIIGSETYGMIKTCGLPVLAVPEMASFTGLQKMVFATDYQTSDIDQLEFLLRIAEHLQATVEVVHVAENDLKETEKWAYMNQLKEEVLARIQYNKLHFKFLYAANVAERLGMFLDESGADLLALVSRKRNFIDQLFSKSLTKKMVYHTHTPMLIFS